MTGERWVTGWLWDRGGLQIQASNLRRVKVAVAVAAAAGVAIVVAAVVGDEVVRTEAAGGGGMGIVVGSGAVRGWRFMLLMWWWAFIVWLGLWSPGPKDQNAKALPFVDSFF